MNKTEQINIIIGLYNYNNITINIGVYNSVILPYNIILKGGGENYLIFHIKNGNPQGWRYSTVGKVHALNIADLSSIPSSTSLSMTSSNS